MRLVMMGSGRFAEPTFLALLQGRHPVVGLVTQPDRNKGQERGSTRQTGRGMKTIATEYDIPVFQPDGINTPEGIAGLREFQPDLLVVAAYGQILSRDVLAVPSQGGINVHASLLPKYRGAAPVAWAIYHGETRTGVTIIRMSVALDAGDMLAQEAIDIGSEETAGELEDRLAELGVRLAVNVIEQIETGTVQGIKQDKSQATKAPKLTKEHGLIDWSRSGQEVCNQIRAMQPWPTAYTFWHRHGELAVEPTRLIIYKADLAPIYKADLAPISPSLIGKGGIVPGDVLLSDSSQLIVGTGGGTAVQIRELQPAGRRRMSAAEFLRGHPPQPGDRMGPAGLATGQ
jgi:methionyl-tRNA formyltransferase